jgi:hypothetical protein
MDLAFDPTPRDRDAERARLDARLDSILTVAGTGPILQPEPADHAAAAEAAVLRAARTDWRAAAWLLEHSPQTRELWSDAARVLALYRANTAATVRGIERWARDEQIPPQTVRTLLLHLQAAGTAELGEVPD